LKKIILILAVALAASGMTVTAQAAPGSTYNQFLQSLDAVTSVTIPIADDIVMPAPAAGLAAGTINIAKSLLGSRVVWGGASPAQGFDCSGFVQYVFQQAGVDLPRTADLQFLVGRTVPRAALRPGDLVYFTTYAPGASHVGIYIGQDKFIHTSFSQGIVAIADINDTYFVQRYYGAKRVL
jgi:cell wall-associated NlpC family hydrolase